MEYMLKIKWKIDINTTIYERAADSAQKEERL